MEPQRLSLCGYIRLSVPSSSRVAPSRNGGHPVLGLLDMRESGFNLLPPAPPLFAPLGGDINAYRLVVHPGVLHDRDHVVFVPQDLRKSQKISVVFGLLKEGESDYISEKMRVNCAPSINRGRLFYCFLKLLS